MDKTTTFDFRDINPFPIDGLADRAQQSDASHATTGQGVASLAWVPWGCETQLGDTVAAPAHGA